MKAFHIILTGVLLFACGLLPAPIAATPTMSPIPTSTPSLTPSPDPAATQKAILAMTQTAYLENIHVKSTKRAKPASTAIGTLSAVLEETINTSNDIKDLDISEAELVFGPVNNSIKSFLDERIATYDTGLTLMNFILAVTFVNPLDTSSANSWDYGIFFRNSHGNDQYRLMIRADGSWSLINANTWLNISRGKDENLNTMAGESNSIWLVVIDEKAFLFINYIYLKTLGVRAKLTAGDISLATGFEPDKKTSYNIEFRDFTVWSLP